MLIGEEVWGMNRINKIYTEDGWRPTRIFWSDMVNPDNYEDIMVHMNADYDVYCTSIVSRHLSGEMQPGRYGGHNWSMPKPYMKIPDKVHNYEYCEEHGPKEVRKMTGGQPPSWRSCVEPGVYCRYGATMQVTLMHAVEEEYNPIYLIGVDLGYVPSLMGASVNNFCDDYQVQDIPPYKATGKNRDYAIAHGMARHYAEERGIKIYNATIGGQLEAYERVDFNSLF